METQHTPEERLTLVEAKVITLETTLGNLLKQLERDVERAAMQAVAESVVEAESAPAAEEVALAAPPPTVLILYLHPKNEEHAMYLVGEESLTQAGIGYRVVEKDVSQAGVPGYAPFTFAHHELQLTLALSRPITPHVIKEIADHQAIGLIYGFSIKGEIDLGSKDETHIINNLEG